MNNIALFADHLFMQFLSLSLYTVLVGICFCDGFKLDIIKKLVWFLVFLAVSAWVLKEKGQYDLALILPIPTSLAIILCFYQKFKKAK